MEYWVAVLLPLVIMLINFDYSVEFLSINNWMSILFQLAR